ncbi:hypothetical protein LSCM1_06452 [Leishmania martiniquensis]|uniref:AAA+ ATPase domain-containing protein n=1 Tax=Leishmania martiniquensis TaxID=1580590 RepID=A0A836GRK1_9TRYP|nr:hypothetical protein LSCM1_06452 [Leishmania martiniquensis]
MLDEECIGGSELPHEHPTPPRSPTPAESASAGTSCLRTFEREALLQEVHKGDDEENAGDGVEALSVQHPDPQRGADLSASRTSHCSSSLGSLSARTAASGAPEAAADTAEAKGQSCESGDGDSNVGLRPVHTAPILQASGLQDYFTYGIQSAIRHYAELLDGTSGEKMDEAHGEMGESAGTLYSDRVTTPATLPASFYGTQQRGIPRYQNVFLEDRSDAPQCNVSTAHHRTRAASHSSQDSSAATYDSDVERTSLPSPRGAAGTEKACLLNPLQTSLFRAARRPDGRGVMADGSWLATAAPTNAHTSSVLWSDSAQKANHRGGDSAQVHFREALRRAYQCEDAHRQRRRAQLDKQREQLLRGLALLQGVPFSSSAALLSELLPSRVRDGRRCADALRSPVSLQQQPPRLGGSSLSLLATCAETAFGRGTDSTTQQAGKSIEDETSLAQPSGIGDNGTAVASRCLSAEAACVVESSTGKRSVFDIGTGETFLSSPPEAAAARPMGAVPKRLLQVMSSVHVQRLRRPLNPFIEALLRHHQDAQLKQRTVRDAEDQAIHARRMYELPVLTEDVVRYAALLLCLRRRNHGGGGTAFTCAASKEHRSTVSRAEPPHPPAAVAADSATALPFGEEGTLLYAKYPAPLLRTTSFAVETVRLLKWLRTWKKSRLGAACGAGGVSGGGSRVGGGNSVSGGNSSGKRQRKSSRKRLRTDVVKLNSDSGEDDDHSDDDGEVVAVASPTPAPFAAASSSTTAEALPPNRSTVEHVRREAQRAVELQEAQVRQERCSAFLKFFGAASGAASAATPSPIKGSELKVKAVQDQEDASCGAREAEVREPTSCSAVSKSAGSSRGARDTADSSVRPTCSITSSLAPISPTSGQTQLRRSQLSPASHAYQLYCYAWKHVVRTGITPLAVVANLFSSPNAVTGQALQNRCDSGTAAAQVGKDTSWSTGAISRVCAALPFFKEMREEARRTALGSASYGAYYEDAFGNRLRSARIAKKEQEKRALLAARQRRRSKRKGYFHRDDGNDGALGGRSADSGASAMLEAMLQSFTSCGNERGTAACGKKRQRSTSSASSACSGDADSEGEGVVKGVQPLGGSGCATAFRGRRVRSRAASLESSSSQLSSRSSSSTASIVSAESNQDESGAQEELTNIAVVSGPTGSGKTAAVYVAAQLLGFRVVEMNASVRRCSKTVEHLLAELTRSYRLSGLRPGSAGGFNAGEELAKLKQQHAVTVERARAEAEAAGRKAELKRREALKMNGISAQAVARFFAKSSGRTTAPSSKSAECSNGNGAVEQVADVTVVSEAPPSAAATAPALPPPSAAAPGAPVGAGTLLLFEDADVLLGDESAKPFYAAIRDLAHRSKVPIVVTVSSDPAAGQRYDTEPLLGLFDGQPQQRPPTPTSPESVLQPTYWHLCNAAGLNSTMATLEAAQQALQMEVDQGNRGASTATAMAMTAASNENGGSLSTVGDGGGSTGASPVSGASAASLSYPVGISVPAAGTWMSGPGAGVSTAAVGGGGAAGSASTAASAAASSAAARYTHVLLNPHLVSSFFGSQTPFTVVEPLPPSALYAQLLAVGAVELNLLRLDEPTTSSDGSQEATAPSSSLWQQEMERMAASLTVRDTCRFLQLAERLRHHIFGAWNMVGEETGASMSPSLVAEHSLVSAVQCDAARRTTTDIRYWLNKLQVLLLSLRVGSSAAQLGNAPEEETSSKPVTRKRPRETKAAPSEATAAACWDDRVMCRESVVSHRRAEHLVEAEFQHRVSLAASEWDSALGRYLSNVAHNEQHSARYVHWFLDGHVNYIPDIVEELATMDHPTGRLHYTTPLHVPPSPSDAAQPARSRDPPSALPPRKKPACASSSEKTTTAPAKAHCQREGAGACVTQYANSSDEGGAGINAAWRSFFAVSGASGLSASSTSPAARGGSKAGGMAVGSPPPPPLSLPARYEWPPSALELRRQASGYTHQRPVELLLPYGVAEDYYGTAAASTSALAPFSIHGTPETTSSLLGHEIPLRFLTRRFVRDASAGDRVEADEDAGLELPASARATQRDRFDVFRRWWRRTRKANALRDSVAGRSAEALEDIVGFGCLLTPSAVATLSVDKGNL